MMIKTLIVSLLIFIFTATVAFADNSLDSLAAQTGGVSLHLNKAEFNKNPTSFVKALVKHTSNTPNIFLVPIPLQESASTTTNAKEFTLQITKEMSTLTISVESTTQIGVDAIQITDPTNTIVKPLSTTQTLNGKIKTNAIIWSPQPGTWHLKITNAQPSFNVTAFYRVEIDRVIVWQAYDIPSQGITKFEFSVDPRLTDLSIAVAAKNKTPTIELLGPDQKPVDAVATPAGATLFKSVAKPAPGMWTVTVTSAESFSLQIIGQSTNFIVSQDFQRRVWGREGMMNIPDDTPLKANTQRQFQIVFFGNPQDHLTDFKMQVVSASGKILSSASVATDASMTGWMNLTSTLIIPAEDFRVMVTGEDDAGNSLQRMGNYLYKMNQ